MALQSDGQTAVGGKADISTIMDPAQVPGSPVYNTSNGTNLGMQAAVAGGFFVVFVLLFGVLRQRWPYIFSPRTRLTITAPAALPGGLFGWVGVTLKTPESHVLNTLGLDCVVFLRFYKMCLRLLLDVCVLSMAVIWPINVRWSKSNVARGVDGTTDVQASKHAVTDYLFNLTLDSDDPQQRWYLLAHIFFAYAFSLIAFYHISRFSSRWASLRWHFLLQSRHARVSRTVMLTQVPRHLAKSPRDLEWYCGKGLGLGAVESVRVCAYNTRLSGGAQRRAAMLVRLEQAYAKMLGNPCGHPEYDGARLERLALTPGDDARAEERVLLAQWAQKGRGRPVAWVRRGAWRLARVDAIDHWRTQYLAADGEFRRLRAQRTGGASCTAFVTFADAASAHVLAQVACYPRPGAMHASLAPEPRGVLWSSVWISRRRAMLLTCIRWICVFAIWALWSAPVVLVSSLVTPESLARVFPALLDARHSMLRAFVSSTLPAVFLLLFLNSLPWVLKQLHVRTGVRSAVQADYQVATKMWAFLVATVVLVFGVSGTFWTQMLDVVNRPGTVAQRLAANLPRAGTFFAGYVVVLGVGYQPFKLLQLRPVVWHVGRRWLCRTPRDHARLVAPVFIDWYSVYPYPLLVFAVAMVYSTFSPPVVLAAVVYFALGYPVMKYLLLYVYFRPFESAGMAWPRVCRRMVAAVILFQAVLTAFVVIKGGGWFSLGMVPLVAASLAFFWRVAWVRMRQAAVLPLYLWRHPPPASAYPMPAAVENKPRVVPRESGRAARARELMLAGRARRTRRARRAGAARRYKSLAEAATAGGSRLLQRTLGSASEGGSAGESTWQPHEYLHTPGDTTLSEQTPANTSVSELTPAASPPPPPPPTAPLARLLQRVRDYFLADFHPAAPILDLTYDRLYSHGQDEHARAPLLGALARVLPRSASRTLAENTTTELPPPPDIPAERPPSLCSSTGPLPAPAAPWLLHSRALSQPASSLSSLTSRASLTAPLHRNSPMPLRPALPARVVSELNYLNRSTPAPMDALGLLPELPALPANYQRFAVEAQSTFEPEPHTDYRQTPMLNFYGVLDRGICEYVHPGLVAELPTLWLPGRHVQSTRAGDEQSSEETPPQPARRLVALAAAYSVFVRVLRYLRLRFVVARQNVADQLAAEEQAYGAPTAALPPLSPLLPADSASEKSCHKPN